MGHYGPLLDTPDDAQLAKNQVPFSIEMVSEFIAKFFSGVCTTPSEYDTCIYTVSHADKTPIDPYIINAVPEKAVGLVKQLLDHQIGQKFIIFS